MNNWKYLRKSFCSKFNSNILYDPNKDYYKLLKVDDKADFDVIKKSFYQQSIKLHPDKGGNEDDFKNLNTAYEVLKNKEDREIYDKLKSEYNDEINSRMKEKPNKNPQSDFKYEYNYNYDFKYESNYESNYSNQNRRKSRRNSNNRQQTYQNYYEQEFNNNRQDSEFDSVLKEKYYTFINKMHEYYSKKYKTKTDNKFDEYKYNVKYTPIEKEIIFEDFKLEKYHKHHISNRKIKYKEKVESLSFFSFKEKKKINPFEITNNMKLDEDYIKALNKEDDGEKLDSRLTIRDMFKVYKLSTFLLMASLNFGVFIYLFIVK